MPRTRELYSFVFVTDLSLPEMLQRLRERGTWKWIERNSDRWGEYISTSGVPDTFVKILVDEPGPGRVTADVKFESEADDADSRHLAIRRTLLDDILPAVGARDVREEEYLE